jgi:hypothetical protein
MNGVARSWGDSDVTGAFQRARAWATENAWLLASVTVVVLGIWLRTRHMFHAPIPFWTDEAHAANELMRGRWFKPSVRPIGFMGVSYWLASSFGPTEATLRFLPWLSGVLGAIVAIPLAGRLVQSPAIRLLFVAIVALHPFTVDFSREFKPYSTSIFVHLSCLWCALAYWQTRSMGWLVASVTIPWFGVLFAQDVLFLYPGLYLAIAVTAWRVPERRRRHLVVGFIAMLLTLALLGALYWYLWRYMSGPQNAGKGKAFGYGKAFFSASWDLFWSPQSGRSRLRWLLGKLSDIAAFPGARRDLWTPPALISPAKLEALWHIDHALWVALVTLGLVRIAYRRRARDLLLVALPIFVAAAFNMKLLWPFAAIRTNLFMLTYTSALACLALDPTDPARARHWSRAVPVLLLVILPLLSFERTWHRLKEATPSGGVLYAAQALLELQGATRPEKPEPLILDGWARDPWNYYSRTNPRNRELFQELRWRVKPHSSGAFSIAPLSLARKVLGHDMGRFWLVVANPTHISQLREGIPRGYRVVARKLVQDDLALVVALQREPFARKRR